MAASTPPSKRPYLSHNLYVKAMGPACAKYANRAAYRVVEMGEGKRVAAWDRNVGFCVDEVACRHADLHFIRTIFLLQQ